MTNEKDQPAFPDRLTTYSAEGHLRTQFRPGLTRREWFAGLAMQGAVSIEYATNRAAIEGIAEMSVQYADALIAELAKEK